MTTNPSVSATSPGPRVPGPAAAERAGPWESQHLCRGAAGGAGGAGGGDRPPALLLQACSPELACSTPQPGEWNEWVPMGAGVLGRSRKPK